MRRWRNAGVHGRMLAILAVGLLIAATPAATQPRLIPVTAASVSAHWSVTLAPAVALQKGYWRDEGLDVKFTVVGPAATHVAALAGGSLQFSVNLTTDTLARAAGGGGKVYGIMGSTNQNSYALFARPQFKTIADLRGKRIATDTPGGPIDTFTAEVLASAGLSPRDVMMIPVAGTITERLNAMVAGAADAAIGSMPDWPTLRPQGMNLLFRLSALYPNWQFAVMATSGSVVDTNPSAVKGWIKGMIRALQFTKDPRNEAELLQIAKAARIGVDEAHWAEGLAVQREFWPADGGLNLAGTEIVLLRERDAGRIPKELTLARFVRLAPLQDAQRELGLRK